MGTPSQGGGGGYNPRSGGSGGKTRKSSDEQTFLPVTISMALRASSSPQTGGVVTLADSGQPLHHVRIVGAVRSHEDMSTNAMYQIEDGTGLIDVKQWVDENDCTAIAQIRQQTLKENIYVKIYGQLKDYEGKKSILAESIRPLSTGDELTHHFLEVIHTAENYGKQQAASGFPVNPMASLGGVGFAGAPVQQQSGPVSGENAAREDILHYIRSYGESDENGASVPALISTFAGKYSEETIRNEVEFLAAEGNIYSTINEDHFKFAA